MKILMIGDMHFGKKCTVPEFVAYQERELDRAVAYAVDNGIKEVVILGDMCDDRKSIYVPTMRLLKRKFNSYAVETDVDFTLVIGNHDVFYKNTNDLNSPREMFEDFTGGFNIVDSKPVTRNIGGQSCLFMPWMATDFYGEWISFLETSPADYCFGHFEINGFVMNNSNTCRSQLKAEHFRNFKQTFSGHFHTKSSKSGVTYVGSLAQLDWSDHDQAKGFHVLDTETGVVEFVESPETIFRKVLIGKKFDFASVAELKDCFLKVYINRKLTSKENVLLGDLVARNISYELIDNTILEDVKVDEVVESEDFYEIVAACIDTQEISDADKKAVAALINQYHEEMIQEKRQ